MPPKKSPGDVHKSVQELLEIRRKHKEELEQVDQHLSARLEEAFESVWNDKLKPVLNTLQDTAAGVLNDFSDFEDQFRRYMRVREPDINVDLLEDILHDPNSEKAKDARKRVTRTAGEKAKLLKKYEQAKGIGLGAIYLQSQGIRTASQIARWKEDPEVQKLL